MRPHEALWQTTPASWYQPSARRYPEREPEAVYPEGCLLRRVSVRGAFSWKHEFVFVSEVLTGEWIGLRRSEEDLYEVYYGPIPLGWFAAYRRFVPVQSVKPGRG